MKRISLLLALAVCAASPCLFGADPAVEEHLNKISAQIQDLIDAKDAQGKQIQELARQLHELQNQQAKPNASYASQDDVKQLAAKIQEVDRKRQEDNELIVKKIEGLGKSLSSTPASRPTPPPNPAETASAAPTPDKGFEHIVRSGDTLSTIAKAYSDQTKTKITVDQILKANPGLKPEKLRVDQKIFVPTGQ